MQRNRWSQSPSAIPWSRYLDRAPWPLLAITDLLSCYHLMSDKFIGHTAWQGNNGGGINGTLLIFLPSTAASLAAENPSSAPSGAGNSTAHAQPLLNQGNSMKHGAVGAMREVLWEHRVMWGHGQRQMAQSFPAPGFWSQQVKVQPPWQMQPSSLEGFKLRSKGIKQQWANECVVPG